MTRGNVILLGVLIATAGVIYGEYSVIQSGFSARDNPSVIETYVARSARHLAVPAAFRKQESPVAGNPEVLAEARIHFADHCATCHGNDGSGQIQIGQNLYPKAPDMRLRATQNLSDGELYWIIHNGIRLTGMPAWGNAQGEDQDSWKLGLFIRSLPQLTPEEKKEMERYNPKSEMERSEEREEQEFLRSEEPGGRPLPKMKGMRQQHH